jgi:hypothetical protein
MKPKAFLTWFVPMIPPDYHHPNHIPDLNTIQLFIFTHSAHTVQHIYVSTTQSHIYQY